MNSNKWGKLYSCSLFLLQRWLQTIRLIPAFWSQTWRIKSPIPCWGNIVTKPRNPTYAPWLTLAKRSPVQVGCFPTRIMVIQVPVWCSSFFIINILPFHFFMHFLFLLYNQNMIYPHKVQLKQNYESLDLI